MRNHNKEKSNEHTGWQMQREQPGAGGADTGEAGKDCPGKENHGGLCCSLRVGRAPGGGLCRHKGIR